MKTSPLALSALLSGAAALKVVSFDLKRSDTARKSLARRDVHSSGLTPTGSAYLVNMTIGTPPQSVALQLDTGSSELWALRQGVNYCQNNTCFGGYFDPSKSTSYELYSEGGFANKYGVGYANGDIAYDTITIAESTVSKQRFSVVNDTDEDLGIFGVGFDSNEAYCAQNSLTPDKCPIYPTFIDNLVKNGEIEKKAYSVWLGDINNTAGDITFGGVDSSKYTGDLVVVPLVPYFSNGDYGTFQVSWTNMTIGTPKGSLDGGWVDGATYSALLDSGSTQCIFPQEVAGGLYKAFGAERIVVQGNEAYIVDCNLLESELTVDFTFGGPTGITIKVPIRELVTVPSQSLPFGNGDSVCQTAWTSTNTTNIILGDSFLRSAYVVYDITDAQLGLAQANFNPGTSSVKEITDDQIPGAVRTASAYKVSQVTTGSFSIATVATSGSVPAPSGYPAEQFITATYKAGASGVTTTTPVAASSGAAMTSSASGVPNPGAGTAISPAMQTVFTAAFGVVLAVSGMGMLML